MSKKIILNSKNYDSATQTFTYIFPFEQDFTNYELGVTTFSMFNSWYNISSTIGNNRVTISYPDLSGNYISFNITLPDGFYDTISFSSYIQSQMFLNNFYYTNNEGLIVYLLELAVNSVEYKNYINFYKMNSKTINGRTYDNTNDYFCKISFSNGLGALFGFMDNIFYGPGKKVLSVDNAISLASIIVPQINPFNALILLCDRVEQIGLCNPSNYLYSTALNSAYGSLIEPNKCDVIYTRCRPGFTKSISINIVDNNFNKLSILDNNTLIILCFRHI